MLLFWCVVILVTFLLLFRVGFDATPSVPLNDVTTGCAQSHEAAMRQASKITPSEGLKGSDTIFVSVASYRDKDVTATVRDLFRTAKHPEKVVVGLVTQNKSSDEDYTPSPNENVRLLAIPHTEARGPCFARFLCSKLYSGETYYMQIDSHTRFVNGWDEQLVRMMKELPDKTILTHYPQAWDNMQTHTVPVNDRSVRFKNYFKYKAYNRPTHGQRTYRESIGVAGGFMFAPGSMLLDCPMDSRLNYVFNGEEFLYSARLYTYGYHFKAPCENVVYHHYYRHGEPKFTHDHPGHEVTAPGIVNYLYHSEGRPYFGAERAKEDYFKMCESHQV